jgi:hypothetical protein
MSENTVYQDLAQQANRGWLDIQTRFDGIVQGFGATSKVVDLTDRSHVASGRGEWLGLRFESDQRRRIRHSRARSRD